ncbi:hypothetical protein MLD38_018437 [Melastoma candidum]|uniref:Uncharacterized protein n=1 Tax=Melastoma candidum TaxID=119954 RepID=A0ACB9QTR8_9MYRT|nr:hypothetical protein MLD38_018437 [Melastoma candidum]
MEVRRSFRIDPRKSKPLMLLKDFLLDDLSSCSSSGFRSFPRHLRRSSTPTSIRLLLEVDLRDGIPSVVAAKTNKRKSLKRTSSSTLFRTAAVKLVKAMKSPLRTTCFLPHGGRAARKLLTREVEEDVVQWRLLSNREIVEGQDVVPSVTTLGSEFAAEVGSSGGEKGIVSEGKGAEATSVEEDSTGTDGRDCIGGEAAANPCSKERLKEKEQFSPVSVLDCPFDEDDDDNDAPSDCSPANLRTGRGRGRHGGVSRLAPLQLEERIASLVLEEEEEAARLDGSIPWLRLTACLVGGESWEKEKDNTEAMFERMLETVKANIRSYDSKSDVLLLDFFREKMEDGLREGSADHRGRNRFKHEAARAAELWVRGEETRETYLGWEMEEGRKAYVKGMDRGMVKWDVMGNHGATDSERYEVCLDVEGDVWTLLVYEVLIDIFG